MGEITRDEMRERLGNIDQIRDIIFGPQLREYDRRIDKLESNLSLLEQEMRDRLEQVKTTCVTELRSAVDSLEKKNKSLSLDFHNDNAELRQMLDRVNKKFSTSLEALDKSVDEQTTSIHNNLSETRGTLQEDIHNLRTQIFEELERRFSRIVSANVSKDDMAEILFELGLRVKGTEFAPELKEAAGANLPNDMRLLEVSQPPSE